jgi:hypothetical protein
MVSNAQLAYLTEQAMILANFVALAERICDTPGIQES